MVQLSPEQITQLQPYFKLVEDRLNKERGVFSSEIKINASNIEQHNPAFLKLIEGDYNRLVERSMYIPEFRRVATPGSDLATVARDGKWDLETYGLATEMMFLLGDDTDKNIDAYDDFLKQPLQGNPKAVPLGYAWDIAVQKQVLKQYAPDDEKAPSPIQLIHSANQILAGPEKAQELEEQYARKAFSASATQTEKLRVWLNANREKINALIGDNPNKLDFEIAEIPANQNKINSPQLLRAMRQAEAILQPRADGTMASLPLAYEFRERTAPLRSVAPAMLSYAAIYETYGADIKNLSDDPVIFNAQQALLMLKTNILRAAGATGLINEEGAKKLLNADNALNVDEPEFMEHYAQLERQSDNIINRIFPTQESMKDVDLIPGPALKKALMDKQATEQEADLVLTARALNIAITGMPSRYQDALIKSLTTARQKVADAEHAKAQAEEARLQREREQAAAAATGPAASGTASTGSTAGAPTPGAPGSTPPAGTPAGGTPAARTSSAAAPAQGLTPDQIRSRFTSAYLAYVTNAERSFDIQPADGYYDGVTEARISDYVGTQFDAHFAKKQQNGFLDVQAEIMGADGKPSIGAFAIDKKGQIFELTVGQNGEQRRGVNPVGNIRQNAKPHPATVQVLGDIWAEKNAQLEAAKTTEQPEQTAPKKLPAAMAAHLRNTLGANLTDSEIDDIVTEFKKPDATDEMRKAVLLKHKKEGPAIAEDDMFFLMLDTHWTVKNQDSANDNAARSHTELAKDVRKLDAAHDLFRFLALGTSNDLNAQDELRATVRGKAKDNILALPAYELVNGMREGEHVALDVLYDTPERKKSIEDYFKGRTQTIGGIVSVTREQVYQYVQGEMNKAAIAKLGSLDKVSQAMIAGRFNPYEKDVEMAFKAFNRPSWDDPTLSNLVKRQRDQNNYPGYSRDGNPLHSQSKTFMRDHLTLNEQHEILRKLTPDDILKMGDEAAVYFSGDLKMSIARWKTLSDDEKRNHLAVFNEPQNVTEITKRWSQAGDNRKDFMLGAIVKLEPEAVRKHPGYERATMSFVEDHMGNYMFMRARNWNGTYGDLTKSQTMDIYLQMNRNQLRKIFSPEACEIFFDQNSRRKGLDFDTVMKQLSPDDQAKLQAGVDRVTNPNAYFHMLGLNRDEYRKKRGEYLDRQEPDRKIAEGLSGKFITPAEGGSAQAVPAPTPPAATTPASAAQDQPAATNPPAATPAPSG